MYIYFTHTLNLFENKYTLHWNLSSPSNTLPMNVLAYIRNRRKWHNKRSHSVRIFHIHRMPHISYIMQHTEQILHALSPQGTLRLFVAPFAFSFHTFRQCYSIMHTFFTLHIVSVRFTFDAHLNSRNSLHARRRIKFWLVLL